MDKQKRRKNWEGGETWLGVGDFNPENALNH
jgi:hypothetical protein